MTFPESLYEIAPLILKFFRDELSYEECFKLNNWISESETNQAFFGTISVRKLLESNITFRADVVWRKLKRKISANASETFFSLYQIDKSKVMQCEKLSFQLETAYLKSLINNVVSLNDEFDSSLDHNHLHQTTETLNIRHAFPALD